MVEMCLGEFGEISGFALFLLKILYLTVHILLFSKIVGIQIKIGM